jgi:hypothetical protein
MQQMQYKCIIMNQYIVTRLYNCVKKKKRKGKVKISLQQVVEAHRIVRH